jgi:hypothetical protein
MHRLTISAMTAAVLALCASGAAVAMVIPGAGPMPTPMCSWQGDMEQEAVDEFIDRHQLRTTQATVERWGDCIKVTYNGMIDYYDPNA